MIHLTKSFSLRPNGKRPPILSYHSKHRNLPIPLAGPSQFIVTDYSSFCLEQAQTREQHAREATLQQQQQQQSHPNQSQQQQTRKHKKIIKPIIIPPEEVYSSSLNNPYKTPPHDKTKNIQQIQQPKQPKKRKLIHTTEANEPTVLLPQQMKEEEKAISARNLFQSTTMQTVSLYSSTVSLPTGTDPHMDTLLDNMNGRKQEKQQGQQQAVMMIGCQFSPCNESQKFILMDIHHFQWHVDLEIQNRQTQKPVKKEFQDVSDVHHLICNEHDGFIESCPSSPLLLSSPPPLLDDIVSGFLSDCDLIL